MNEKLAKQLALFQQLVILYTKLMNANSERLYEAAIAVLGTDASPKDLVNDDVGCAETVTNIIKKVIFYFPIITGTWTLQEELKKSKLFKEIFKPEKGVIIICATATGNNTMPGHVGIIGEFNGAEWNIMSNDSKTGKFLKNYTTSSWGIRYVQKGGFTNRYFKLI